jgi:hypothetical protein
VHVMGDVCSVTIRTGTEHWHWKWVVVCMLRCMRLRAARTDQVFAAFTDNCQRLTSFYAHYDRLVSSPAAVAATPIAGMSGRQPLVGDLVRAVAALAQSTCVYCCVRCLLDVESPVADIVGVVAMARSV